MNNPGDITKLLFDLREKKPGAAALLMPLVYDELRRVASRQMRGERLDHTLQATVLVHEAYLKLIDQDDRDWQNRAHFFATAANLMRRILIDHARRHRSKKRGGARKRVDLERVLLFNEEQYDDLIALDTALSNLSLQDARLARVVELRYFAELSFKEIAVVIGVSDRTVKRDWEFARTWLAQELNPREIK